MVLEQNNQILDMKKGNNIYCIIPVSTTTKKLQDKQEKNLKEETLTCPPAARCANINASLPGGRTPPTPATRLIICLLFLPRFPGVGMTTAGGTAMSPFLSGNKRQVKTEDSG